MTVYILFLGRRDDLDEPFTYDVNAVYADRDDACAAAREIAKRYNWREFNRALDWGNDNGVWAYIESFSLIEKFEDEEDTKQD